MTANERRRRPRARQALWALALLGAAGVAARAVVSASCAMDAETAQAPHVGDASEPESRWARFKPARGRDESPPGHTDGSDGRHLTSGRSNADARSAKAPDIPAAGFSLGGRPPWIPPAPGSAERAARLAELREGLAAARRAGDGRAAKMIESFIERVEAARPEPAAGPEPSEGPPADVVAHVPETSP